MNHLKQLIESEIENFPEAKEEYVRTLITRIYKSGLQRAKELVGEKRTSEYLNYDSVGDEMFRSGYNKSREQTLQNIDNEIKSYEN